eukprot:CAMPEP_0115164912 /NCGR_PEP_ID=MMETSP0227-20121206/73293_1 /TAXON_ID=89957 /ORGANISM="Polarella glacialis, Strain CCMP 1383" /LENGTH=190 /DNA_ID=CAMNT_0002577311 /DNA_START=109 /DNA_END=682 /DNA_ORIENTATION=+
MRNGSMKISTHGRGIVGQDFCAFQGVPDPSGDQARQDQLVDGDDEGHSNNTVDNFLVALGDRHILGADPEHRELQCELWQHCEKQKCDPRAATDIFHVEAIFKTASMAASSGQMVQAADMNCQSTSPRGTDARAHTWEYDDFSSLLQRTPATGLQDPLAPRILESLAEDQPHQKTIQTRAAPKMRTPHPT